LSYEQQIEHKLTLWAARQPRAPEAQLMLKAAETIYKLRTALAEQKKLARV